MNPAFEANLRWSPAAHRGGGPTLRIDVSLSLGAEAGILFGASGAGKSSILRLVAGLERPEGGTIRIGGEIVFDAAAGIALPLRSRRIGLIFQDDLLFPHLNVAANIRYGLKGLRRDAAEARVAEVAALCGVVPLLARRPETLSGGERQRVGLARALAPRPRMLLCDEPVSALDLAARDILVDRLRAVQRAEAIPILYVTHSSAEAIALGSKLFLLREGRVVDEGPPLDVLGRTADVRLEGVNNRFEARVEGRSAEGGETILGLDDGPTLVVARLDLAPGARVVVGIRADEILLARGPVAGLSARNVIEGTVERVVVHGPEAEVVVKTGGLAWIVGVVTPAVGALGLCAGVAVHMIVKARSCHVVAPDRGA